ncbi:acyltransferase [Elusimicrobiota bacterium]
MRKKPAFYKHPKAVVEKGSVVGAGTKIWAFAHVQKGAKIGANCNICNNCYIESGAVVGNGVTIKNNVSVWEGVKIQDKVFVGPDVVFTNDLFPRSRVPDWELARTLIMKGATIGANATLLSNISVGKRALVGAGSVVTSSIGNHGLVYGNPGKEAGKVCACARRLKKRGKVWICVRCKKQYKNKDFA